MNDHALRFAPPAAATSVRRTTPASPDLLNVAGVAHMLGVGARTLERELKDPTSRIPKPFTVGQGRKRLWLRADIVAYRSALALLGRTRSSPDGE